MANIALAYDVLQPVAGSPRYAYLPLIPRAIRPGDQLLPFGSRTHDDGYPAAPALEWAVAGTFRFAWPIAAGDRSIAVYCRNLSGLPPYPTLRLVANPQVGLASDLVITAASGAAWQQLGPATFTATADGAVQVVLHSPLRGNAPRITRWGEIVTP